MKQMKKILVLVLSLIMVMSAVAACGGNDEPEETEAPETEAEAVEVEEETDAEAEVEEEEAEEEVEEEPATDGLSGQINVYSRDAASGTRDGFESVVDFEDQLTDSANEVASNGEMATQVGKDAQAIGYVSLTTDFEANNLKAVNYEGAIPTEENVLSGEYQLSRPFDFATRAEGDYASDEEEQLVKAFVAFLTESQEGLEAVASEGGIVDLEAATPWDELKADHPIVDQDNSGITIRTGGSTSVEKTVRAALEAFVPYAGNFQFEMDQTGSGDGWKRVLGDEKDGPTSAHIGFASRHFKDEEDVSGAIASGTYCLDAIVTVVEANNPIEDFTQQQLFDIFTGALENWEDVQ